MIIPNIDWFYQPFIRSFQTMQIEVGATNRKKGFDDTDVDIEKLDDFLYSQGMVEFAPLIGALRNARIGLKLALVVSEISEALEAVRTNTEFDDHIPEFSAEEAEIADAVIRLMNYATDRKLRLAEAIVAKNEFNRNRQDHSKDARAGEHGKRF
jgi:hypothetical protein